MIPTRDNGVRVEGSLHGEKIAMGIDASAEEELMIALSGLYSDTEMAVLREYSTNAWDAHVEAGITRPIDVTLPTSLEPYLVIRDYGVGMSVDDIYRVYSKYGASTKRETNDQTGSLGLGSKSGLAYQSRQFSVVTVQDGVRIKAVVSMDEMRPTITILETETTTEENGTSIIIAASRFHNFIQKATYLFSFWEQGTVLVDGKEPKPLQGLRLADDLYIVDGYQSYVVMGKVPYKATLEHGLKDGYSIVAFVSMGEVAFAPNRENLRDTLKTKATIAQIEEQILNKGRKAMQAEIDKAPTASEAIKEFRKWRSSWSIPPGGTYTYKGEEIPSEFKHEGMMVVNYTSYRKQTDYTKQASLQVAMWPKSVWITGWNRPSFTGPARKKMERWLEDNFQYEERREIEYFVLTKPEYFLSEPYMVPMKRQDADPPHPDKKWLDERFIVPWETIKAIKLPTKRGGGGGRGNSKNIPGSYEMVIDGVHHHEVEASKITRNPYYFVGNYNEASLYISIFRHLRKKYTIVLMPSNRKAKFLRSFPKAKELKPEAIKLLQKRMDNLTPDELRSLSLKENSYSMSDVKRVDPKKIDDPGIKKLAEEIQTEANESLSGIWNLAGRMRNSIKRPALPSIKDPFDKYPLWPRLRYELSRHSTDIYLYLNAAYAARTKV